VPCSPQGDLGPPEAAGGPPGASRSLWGSQGLKGPPAGPRGAPGDPPRGPRGATWLPEDPVPLQLQEGHVPSSPRGALGGPWPPSLPDGYQGG
jgi:hypothetical protein